MFAMWRTKKLSRWYNIIISNERKPTKFVAMNVGFQSYIDHYSF
jgi:hypothetical protein